MSMLAANIQRLMARAGMTRTELAERARVDDRTLNQVLHRKCRPHAKTLHKLAAGLDASVDELFQPCVGTARAQFDRQTNPIVDQVLAADPRLCADWGEAEFAELYSHFGTGGGLTYDGASHTIAVINHKRALQEKTAILLETHYADLLSDFVEMLYRRVEVGAPSHEQESSRPS